MSNDQFQLDSAQGSSSMDFVDGIRNAKATGKGMVAMISEIAKLRLGPGKLRPDEYFMYGLYDDNRFSPEAKRTFMSQDCYLLDTPWRTIAKDKPLITAMLQGFGLPVPETQAILHPTRTFGDAKALRDLDQVGDFLRNDAQYPIFGKPFDSNCSVGTVKINEYDKANDSVLAGDQWVPVDGFAKSIEDLGRHYIFQTLLLPHPAITERIGASVSSVRMFVFSDQDGCSLFRAAWKIPASINHADNFWRPGNMLAGVDVETGKIGRTIVRTESGGIEPIAAHPFTQQPFDGMVFPEWEKMREVVLRAAVNLPTCHFQGWDVALTDRGPILVELEGDGGNPIMEQLCFESGLLTERYLDIVKRAEEDEKNYRKRVAEQDSDQFRKNLSALAAPTQNKSDATPDSRADTPSDDTAVMPAPVAVNMPIDSSTTVS